MLLMLLYLHVLLSCVYILLFWWGEDAAVQAVHAPPRCNCLQRVAAASVAVCSVVCGSSCQLVSCCLSVSFDQRWLCCSDVLSVDLYTKEYLAVTSCMLFSSIYRDNSSTTHLFLCLKLSIASLTHSFFPK